MEDPAHDLPPEPTYYKPDWPRAKERWAACWDCAPTDRPLIDVKASLAMDLAPWPAPDDPEDLWLDEEYVCQSWMRQLESTYLGGEAVPVCPYLQAAWALGCGLDVAFTQNTIWLPVTATSMSKSVNYHPGPQDPWRHKLEKVVHHLLDMAPGRFLVGYVVQLPVNDLLPLLRGVELFLTDLAEDCERCRQRLIETLPLWLAEFEYFRGVVDAKQRGCAWGWPGLWHPDFVMATQSDMSCMISGDMFDRYVMPELDVLGERYARLWYHLDGPEAVRHVPRLLRRSYMRAIQYVPGDGQPPNGPAHLDLYRQVQAARRCLDLHTPPENVEFVIRHLRPEGLIVRTWASTREQADELVHLAAKWCGTHANAI